MKGITERQLIEIENMTADQFNALKKLMELKCLRAVLLSEPYWVVSVV